LKRTPGIEKKENYWWGGGEANSQKLPSRSVASKRKKSRGGAKKSKSTLERETGKKTLTPKPKECKKNPSHGGKPELGEQEKDEEFR